MTQPRYNKDYSLVERIHTTQQAYTIQHNKIVETWSNKIHQPNFQIVDDINAIRLVISKSGAKQYQYNAWESIETTYCEDQLLGYTKYISSKSNLQAPNNRVRSFILTTYRSEPSGPPGHGGGDIDCMNRQWVSLTHQRGGKGRSSPLNTAE